MPRAAYAVAAYADARKFSAFFKCVFECLGVVAHKYDRRLFKVVEVCVGEFSARLRCRFWYAKPVCVPFAPVAVPAEVYRAYMGVAVVAFGELFHKACMQLYKQRLVEIRRIARHCGEGAFWVLPLLLPVVRLVFYAFVESPFRGGVGLFAVVVCAGYAERYGQADFGVIFDEFVDFGPVVLAVFRLKIRPVVASVADAVREYSVRSRLLRA